MLQAVCIFRERGERAGPKRLLKKSRESYSVWWFSLLVSLTALFVAFAECSLFIFQQAVFWPHRALVALCSCLQVR